MLGCCLETLWTILQNVVVWLKHLVQAQDFIFAKIKIKIKIKIPAGQALQTLTVMLPVTQHYHRKRKEIKGNDAPYHTNVAVCLRTNLLSEV